ncbi:MAG: dihydrodipicolinate synthase family protein [Acidobacteria bacterium]|nr:MAG: dihydrodipicolinate synthase family protein [Acidobacteriota bacterium]
MGGSDGDRLPALRRALGDGLVIPAHPLALTETRRLDERRQIALTRYYADAGAGGIGVGVHTTQFAIRDPGVDLLRPVLELAIRAAREWCAARRIITIAGVCGPTRQAVAEAELAASLDYDAALVSLAALGDEGNAALLGHCRRVSDVIPVMGFYLQPAVGGPILDRAFWRDFLEIERVVAIKVAPFDRYATLDVAAALAESGRRDVALYTGNDDSIVTDLLTPFPGSVRFSGGLLGQWAVWTTKAVELLRQCRTITRCEATRERQGEVLRLLALGAELTDANAALFDPSHLFAGCISGIHEVLRRQGLLAGRWCLDPNEDLSPGQMREIDRVLAAYPHLADDGFVRDNLDRWLR